MAPKILMLDNPLSAMDIARELAPSGFDIVSARRLISVPATRAVQSIGRPGEYRF
jgi:ABC-type nitrate/sulfonate/bicarbonate transport system ATPase subunit